MQVTKKRFWLIFAVTVAVACLAGIMWVIRQDTGLKTTLSYRGTQPISSLRLYVTGSATERSYLVGDLSPNQEASVLVRPITESHLEIEFVNSDGTWKRINAGGYYEQGYRGSCTIEFDSERVLSVQENAYPL
jgi:hypothetical protein